MGAFQEVQALFSKRLASHIKESQELAYSYGIHFHAARKNGHHEPFPEIEWRTQFGFVLYVQNELVNIPIAAIGFEWESTHLFVKKLDCGKDMGKYLRPLNYEHLLYRILILFGQKLRVKEIRVIPVSESELDLFDEIECSAQKEHLCTIYEKIPKYCGFRLDKDTHIYTYVLLY